MRTKPMMHSAGSRSLWRFTTGLGLLALSCGLLLGGLSAWFLGSVALAGLSAAAFTFNFHMPAALVRLFALGRTAARYGERLFGHEAALVDQSTRRVALFSSMAGAPSVRQAGWQLADEARLAEYLDDVEDIDFARLRADLPAALLAAGIACATAATLVLAPLALLPIGGLLAALTIASHRLSREGTTAWTQARALRREGAQRLGAALAAVVPLQAEDGWSSHSETALAQFSQADRAEQALRSRQASLDALAALLGPVAAVGVLIASWMCGLRGDALLVPAFLAFVWLTLGETAQGLPRIVVALLRRRAARAALARWQTDEASCERARVRHSPWPAKLHHAGLQRRAPNGRPLGQPIAILLEAGRPIVLSGASGIGKTSLLKQIAGWTGKDILDSDAGTLSAADRCALTMVCLHDAAILSDTVRANLFADSASDRDLWQALDAVELSDRIDAGGGLESWITQDSLSLGETQRLNLARAWLSPKPLILLDEPMEHLPAAQANRILRRLLDRLQGRMVVISSHSPVASAGSITLRL